MRFAVLLICLFLSLPALARDAFQGPRVEEFTLANGMRFLLIPDPQSTATIHALWYKVGSSDEPPGKSGLAHFLEHLMYRGTAKHGPTAYGDLVSADGAYYNAFTSYDYTVYHVRVPKPLLSKVMELEADRMRGLVIQKDYMDTDRRIIQEERRQRHENEPEETLRQRMEAVLMRGNPYERPVSGAIEEIEKQVSEDAQAFYDTFYHPENAVAIVNGNLDLAELRALAENYFADIPRGPPHQRIPPAALPPPPAERLIELQSDAAAQTIVLQGYTGPGFGDGTNPEAYALDFLGVILASGTQGRLIKALVLDSKDALDVDVWFEGYRRHGGKLMIRAQLNKGADPLAVKKIIENEIANIITDGVSQAEIDDALNRDKISNVYQWDSNTALTNVLGTRAMLNWPIDGIFAFDGWNKITPAQVQGAAAKYLTVERGVTGILVPKAGSN